MEIRTATADDIAEIAPFFRIVGTVPKAYRSRTQGLVGLHIIMYPGL